MNARATLASAGALGLLATACTLIVGGQLNKYSDYKTGDPLGPAGNTDPCALTPPDAGNACSTCIANSCQADIAYACPEDGGQPKAWFKGMQNCAEHPDEGYSGPGSSFWACSRYDNPDAQPNLNGDDNAREQAALLCIRDHCLQPGTPPCHQCSIGVEKPGQAGGWAALEETTCGKCLRDKCGALLVHCCQRLPPGMTSCAYKDSTTDPKCHAAINADAGSTRPEPTAWNAVCQYDLETQCFPKCQDQCP
jgi:hypothetical protein